MDGERGGTSRREGASERHYDDGEAPLRALLALEAGRMGSWRWDIPGGTVTGDPFVAALLNMADRAQPWPQDEVFASMHPDDLPRVMAEVEHALAGADIYEVEFRDRVTDPDTGEEGLRWLGARGQVTQRDEDGAPLEMIGVNWDATAQKTHEERLALLAGEMDHRVKNAFAVIRALINLGERVPGDKKEFASTLKTQVQAMADAHALLAKLARSNEAPAAAVPISDVLSSALAPWLEVGGLEGGTRRSAPGARADVSIEADEELVIAPSNVSAVAMLAYELATNATKYGPLGEAGGRLRVSVRREGDGVVLRWAESSEHPVARAAAVTEAEQGVASGFGSVLVQHCVSTLRGRMRREMTPEGLRFELTMPLAEPVE